MQYEALMLPKVGLLFLPLLVLVFLRLLGKSLEEPRIESQWPYIQILSLFIPTCSSNQVGGGAGHVTKRQITKAAVCFGTAEWLKIKGGIFGPLL